MKTMKVFFIAKTTIWFLNHFKETLDKEGISVHLMCQVLDYVDVDEYGAENEDEVDVDKHYFVRDEE